MISKYIEKIDVFGLIGCSDLIDIEISEDNPNFTSKDGAIYSKDMTKLIYLAHGRTEIEMPDSVTEICERACSCAEKLEKVKLSKNLRYIRKRAFLGTSIKSIEIPDSVTTIEKNAFEECEKLQNVKLPNKLLSIETGVFLRSGLATVEFPETLKTIGDVAFCKCTKLKGITLPNDLIELGYGAFAECIELKSIILPQNLEVLGNSAFEGTSISSVVFPEKITVIGGFDECALLEKVEFSSGATHIAENAFKNCTKLSELNFPESLNEIGKSAFENCASLSELVIPENVSYIAENAFTGCVGLSDVKFLGQETAISSDALDSKFLKGFTKIGNMNNPRKICYLSTTKPNVNFDIDVDFEIDEKGVLKAIIGTLPQSVLTIPEGVTSIDKNVFKETEIIGVNFPQSLTSIKSNAFLNCRYLTEVEIPDGVTQIGSGAFKGCYSLKSVKLPVGLKKIPNKLFYGCGLKNIEFPQGITNIGASSFMGNKLESLTFPDSVITIGESAFEDNVNVDNITLNDGLKMIERRAFMNCGIMTDLNNVRIPKSVEFMSNCGLYMIDDHDSTGIGIPFGKCMLCYPDTSGEDYAKNNKIPFLPLDDSRKYRVVKYCFDLSSGISEWDVVKYCYDPSSGKSDLDSVLTAYVDNKNLKPGDRYYLIDRIYTTIKKYEIIIKEVLNLSISELNPKGHIKIKIEKIPASKKK